MCNLEAVAPPAAFAPCALVPIYNHGETITRTVRALLAQGLPVIVVDDGSDAPTRNVLDALARTLPGWQLVRLAQNRGKGRALEAGLREAAKSGFTHVLQIDADGQHDTADVPRFLAAAREHPGALVCGCPIYDHSVPRARLYGRYVTHVCVWLETLSFAIRDSMCGYRLYPLAITLNEMARKPFPARMDFDTEVAVRLVWRGVQIVNLHTRVIYPERGLSHFRLWRDNLRISAMHARLLLGMLPRAPRLLWRTFRGKSPCHA